MIWCLAYVPVWLVARMFYVFCYSRSKKSVLVLWGQTLNQLVNMILKNYIAQPRPAHTGYGMPSSHAQFMFFYLTFNPSFMNLLLAVLTCFSRVHDGYHTVEQIIVGAFVGFVCAMAKMETSSFDSDLVDFGNMVVYRLTGCEIVKGEQ
jgi:dolichyldiphosphatase